MASKEYHKLKLELKVKGIKLSLPTGWDGDEMRVNYVDGKEATAYYTNDLDDVKATAENMIKERENSFRVPQPQIIGKGESNMLHEGAVCYDCGRTVTEEEYAYGESHCCNAGVVWFQKKSTGKIDRFTS